MKAFIAILSAFAVISLAVWAYRENYLTQQATAQVRDLHNEIGHGRARLGVLRAEWAYQNRPDRLQDLVNLNLDRLGLFALGQEAFRDVGRIGLMSENERVLELSNIIELSSNAGGDEWP